jgi:SAM-dependent methyltransferase
MLTATEFPGEEARAALRRFGEIDWDFPTQLSESPFSGVHWHPCRFPSQIPALAIGRMCPPGGMVLDPFMGSATTLVESQRLGHPSIGIDVSPVSCLVAASKTINKNIVDIRTTINELRIKILGGWEDIAPNYPPVSVQADKWYMPSTLIDLTKLWRVVTQAEGIGRTISYGCFSAILLPACREDRHWGYVCDNTRPKGSRAPDAKILFLAALQRLLAAYENRRVPASGEFPLSQINNEDARTALARLPNETVDCVVTSPPYFGVTDYVKAQRLTMEWLSNEIEPIRRLEIGARSKRHRTSALSEYLHELESVFREVYRVLKPGGAAIVVFGQSPSRAEAQVGFVESLTRLGFSFWMERQRNISIGRRLVPSVANETVLVVRK